jgi:hypothetical protein
MNNLPGNSMENSKAMKRIRKMQTQENTTFWKTPPAAYSRPEESSTVWSFSVDEDGTSLKIVSAVGVIFKKT